MYLLLPSIHCILTISGSKRNRHPSENEAAPRWFRARLTTPAICIKIPTRSTHQRSRSPHRRITVPAKNGITKILTKSFHLFMEGADHRRTMSYGAKRIFTYLWYIHKCMISYHSIYAAINAYNVDRNQSPTEKPLPPRPSNIWRIDNGFQFPYHLYLKIHVMHSSFVSC